MFSTWRWEGASFAECAVAAGRSASGRKRLQPSVILDWRVAAIAFDDRIGAPAAAICVAWPAL